MSASSSVPTFPQNFLWGVAASSHQVEGNTENDWSEWERSPRRLTDLERRGLLKKHGMTNYISGNACDHYRRYRDDFALAKNLGCDAFRLSLEWSRIEPREGVFDDKELDHYRDVVRTMRAFGMEPFVTLWHWTHPLWFRDLGGWRSPRAVSLFVRYVETVAQKLGEDVHFWITLNEPEVYAASSYLAGRFPPQQKNPIAYFRVLRTLVRAHRDAYHAIKRRQPKAQVGIAKNNVFFEAYRNQLVNRTMKRCADWWVNDWFLAHIAGCQDFIGLNYYFHSRVNLGFNKNENHCVSDMGWELYPDGIVPVLQNLKRYGKPVYITENGLADAEDRHRAWFIARTLQSVHQAIEGGADVRGYFHWSLTDNFEWDKGFWPRFGLVAVDYPTQKRTPRPSASLYRRIILENAVPHDMLKEHSSSTP